MPTAFFYGIKPKLKEIFINVHPHTKNDRATDHIPYSNAYTSHQKHTSNRVSIDGRKDPTTRLSMRVDISFEI